MGKVIGLIPEPKEVKEVKEQEKKPAPKPIKKSTKPAEE